MQSLSHYRILGALGEGGMGVVYRAHDTRLGRDVAIKVLHPQVARDDNRRNRFLREARAAAALNHPNVATVYSIEEHDSILYLVMEFIDGSTLKDVIERQGRHGLRVDQALDCTADILKALQAAHTRGIVHRDIKPTNVMLPSGGGLKVLDFGLAKMADNNLESQTNAIMGTLAYMSPEQASGSPLDRRTDLWSTGVVLYEMLTGKLPFPGKTQHAVFHAIASQNPVPPTQLRPGLPGQVIGILERALTKDVAARYESAAAMLVDVENGRALASGISSRDPLWSDTGSTIFSPAATSTPRRPRSSSLSAPERRQLTILHCQFRSPLLSPSGEDIELYQQVFAEFQQLTEKIAYRFEGHLAAWLSDGAVIYFGYPAAQEDSARRALATGIGVVEGARRLAEAAQGAPRGQLAIRAGIDTGMVVVDPKRAEAVIGESPVVARGLAGIAPDNSLVISRETFRLVENHAHCDEIGALSLAGVNRTVQGYRVVHLSSARSRFQSAAPASLAPLSGREQELALLLSRWKEAAEGSGQAVMLSGSAGMGKSRLIHEVKKRVAEDPSAWLIECSCSPFHQGTALYPLLDFYERMVLDLEQDATSEQKFRRLEGLLAEFGLPLEENVPLLAPLFGLTYTSRYRPPELTPERQRILATEALLSLLFERASHQPVLFIVEDLHWADPSTIDLLDMLIDRCPTVPLLALLSHRPDFHPQWGARTHVSLVALNRLSSEHARHIAGGVGGQHLPPVLLERIVANSDGVPLFVEELTKMVLQAGTVHSQSVERLAIPTTLRDSFTARLDNLGEAKDVAQIAAVLGREFPLALLKKVTELGEDRLERALAKLVEAEVLYPRGFKERLRYLFKHALLQDCAYEALLRNDRIAIHRRAAEALVEHFPDLVSKQPELAAHHFTEADLGALAIPHWHRAGFHALTRSAYREAIALLNRALDIYRALPQQGRSPEQELLLLTSLGLPLIGTRGFGAEEVGDLYRRALELCSQAGGDSPYFLQSLHGVWIYNLVRGNLATAREIATRMVDEGRARNSPNMLVEGYWTLGNCLFWSGEFAAALENLNRTLEAYDPERFGAHAFQFGQDPAVAAHCYASFCHWYLGAPEQGEKHVEAALSLARNLKHPFSIGWGLTFRMFLRYLAREPEAAIAAADEAIAYCNEQAYPFWITCSLVVKGWALCHTGRSAEGIPVMEQGVEGIRAIGSLVILPLFQAIRAEALGVAGYHEEALGFLDESLALARAQNGLVSEAELNRVRGVLLLRAPGRDRSEALLSLEASLELARRSNSPFLEHRAIVEVAKSAGANSG